ncbi:hypothetical protein BB560_000958 [Smittium megazygosporum]|uniref:DML1/Misato tubulin domain-containing protein n=1 Tax=Smittium megazygosporum TaxID=133381 RepID=A0A2T9ZIX2_9FUNG|nr:hypothetical protein BB560_000958 [Smittium megazygosporum]
MILLDFSKNCSIKFRILEEVVNVPRALIFDFNENYGELDLIDQETVEEEEDYSEQQMEIYKQPKTKQVDKPGIDKEPKFWSDFCSLPFKQDSFVKFSRFERWSFFDGGASKCGYQTGKLAFQSLEKEESVLDSEFRNLLESCDSISGIQMISDSSGEFAGFANGFLEYICDELNKTSCFVYPVSESPSILWDINRSSDMAIQLASNSELEYPVIPLIRPLLKNRSKDPIISSLNANSWYQSSFLMSLVIDSINFPKINSNISANDFLNKVGYSNTELPISSKLSFLTDSNSPLEPEWIEFLYSTENKSKSEGSKNSLEISRGFDEYSGFDYEWNLNVKTVLELENPNINKGKELAGGAFKYDCGKDSIDFCTKVLKDLKNNYLYRNFFGRDEIYDYEEVLFEKIEQNQD